MENLQVHEIGIVNINLGIKYYTFECEFILEIVITNRQIITTICKLIQILLFRHCLLQCYSKNGISMFFAVQGE